MKFGHGTDRAPRAGKSYPLRGVKGRYPPKTCLSSHKPIHKSHGPGTKPRPKGQAY